MGYEKAVLIPEDGKKEIKVQFNPAEYNLSRSTTYAEKKVLGLDDPFTQYIAGEAETLKITLMFDTYSHIPLDGKRKYPCSVRIPGQDEMPDAL